MDALSFPELLLLRAIRLLLIAAVLSSSSVVWAQSVDVQTFCGTYVYVGGDEQRADRDRALEKAVSTMNRFMRPLARAGLRQAAGVAERLVFSSDAPGTISIAVGRRSPIETKTDGRPYKVRLGAGFRITVKRVWRGTSLFAVASKGDTYRRTAYQFSPDGKTLSVTIMIEAKQLEHMLRYTLSYKRLAAGAHALSPK